MKKILFLLLFVMTTSLFGQDCDCEATFKWLTSTFEKNDAGFSYVIEQKGKQAYLSHTNAIKSKLKTITSEEDCVQLFSEWLSFFRSGHVSIRRTNQNNSQNSTAALTNEQIIETYKDAERLDIDIKDFKNYLKSKTTTDFEGIWVSEPYTIGIKKIKNTYIGFIIEADGIYWRKGQVKFKIYADNSSVYYMRDHSERHFESTQLLGKNYIAAGFITLQRKGSKFKTDPLIERYFKAISANKPYFDKIDKNTVYLRIPTFNGAEKRVIDSVIGANKKQILNTKNLIIDIRSNGGGSDRSYKELLPFMYTNPIRTVGVEYYSTTLNNQRMLDFINEPKYDFNEEEKQWAKKSYDTLSKHIGSYVNLNASVVDITEYDKVTRYPENIGILINEGNGSTAEQFLLAAKQSRKVKLYGTTTVGVLDISNMYFVTSPCGNYQLGYCLTRSMRIPEMTIDDKGIQPDYYLDKSIPKHEWITHTAKMLNN